MLWPRSIPPAPSALPASAPASDVLRMAILQASWARDRRVGRRRLALRWIQWALLRYLLPAFLVLCASAVVWVWLVPTLQAALERSTPRSVAASPATHSTPVPAQVEKPDVVTPSSPPVTITPTGLTIERFELNAEPLRLRIESRWGLSKMASAMPDIRDATSLPPLRPENWLHSKEP